LLRVYTTNGLTKKEAGSTTDSVVQNSAEGHAESSSKQTHNKHNLLVSSFFKNSNKSDVSPPKSIISFTKQTNSVVSAGTPSVKVIHRVSSKDSAKLSSGANAVPTEVVMSGKQREGSPDGGARTTSTTAAMTTLKEEDPGFFEGAQKGFELVYKDVTSDIVYFFDTSNDRVWSL
jgi:hypothetical protein